MLNYRVNIKNINKTKVTLPVTSIQFTDFNEIYDETDGTVEKIEYSGINNDKIILTCECEDVDKLKNGSTINAVNTLILNYGTYTFNNEFQVNGVNEDNRSFSIISDKYYVLNVENIFLDDHSNDIDEQNEYEEYNSLKPVNKIRILFKEKHYFNEDENDISIYVKYVNNVGEFKIVKILGRTIYDNALLFDEDKFIEQAEELYNIIFKNKNFDYVNEEQQSCAVADLSGIEILRDNFLFSEFTNYYFEYERAVVNVPIPISNSFDTNLYQSDLLQEHFVEEEKRKAINKIVDLEKDVYYPVIKNDNSFSDVYTLRFNLHFREHRGDNWLVDGNSFWNGVKQENGGIIDTQITGDGVSDLLCFLNFDNNDIRYQKNKLKKSFLRLSFYDSMNPANQNMLGYSTIFLDSGNLFSKYVRYFETDGYKMIGYDKNNYGIYNIDSKPKKGNRVDREYEFDEEYRLSSQFVVKNKNTSTASSEGFYLYLWKDNESVLPQDLYMKVEFNHAGYGRTIPFMMPYWDKQKWNKEKKSGIKTFNEILNDWKDTKIVDGGGNVTWKNKTDGHYGMGQYMKFSYIHLKYQYDKDNDKHIYYIDPETYGNIDFPNGKDGNKEIVINLYEAKVE